MSVSDQFLPSYFFPKKFMKALNVGNILRKKGFRLFQVIIKIYLIIVIIPWGEEAVSFWFNPVDGFTQADLECWLVTIAFLGFSRSHVYVGSYKFIQWENKKLSVLVVNGSHPLWWPSKVDRWMWIVKERKQPSHKLLFCNTSALISQYGASKQVEDTNTVHYSRRQKLIILHLILIYHFLFPLL